MSFTLHINRINFFFRALHFLQDFGKCERLHGHDYYIEVQVRGLQSNENLAVVDFQIIKRDILKIIKIYDKKILIAEKAENQSIYTKNDKLYVKTPDKSYIFSQEICALLPIKATTAEELCKYFFNEIKKNYPSLKVIAILYETKGNQVKFGDF